MCKYLATVMFMVIVTNYEPIKMFSMEIVKYDKLKRMLLHS